MLALSSMAQPRIEILETQELDNRLLAEFVLYEGEEAIYQGRELTGLEWRPEFSEKESVAISVLSAFRMIPPNEYGLHLRYVAGGDTASSMISDRKEPFRQYMKQLYEMENPPLKLRTAVLREEMPQTKRERNQRADTLKTDTLKVQELKKGNMPQKLKLLKSKSSLLLYRSGDLIPYL